MNSLYVIKIRRLWELSCFHYGNLLCLEWQYLHWNRALDVSFVDTSDWEKNVAYGFHVMKANPNCWFCQPLPCLLRPGLDGVWPWCKAVGHIEPSVQHGHCLLLQGMGTIGWRTSPCKTPANKLTWTRLARLMDAAVQGWTDRPQWTRCNTARTYW